MKKTALLLALTTMVLSSCTKTTNNNYGSGMPAFTVDGITSVNLQNSSISTTSMYLSVNYRDSSQQTVTLSLSALPAGIAIDTSWAKVGIPSFSSTLNFYDTTAAGAAPGTYPITITATSASTQKTYKFNLIVKAAPPCSDYVVGKYFSCYSYCSSTSYYADSVFADANIVNKIWFVNFNKTGNLVYGILNCGTSASSYINITIPSQTFGSIIYAGSGSAYKYGSHQINISLTSPSSCQFYDR